MAIDKKGKTYFKENPDKRLALKELEKTVLEEDALQKEWLPDDLASFPRLPGPLSEILKNGNMTKWAAAVNWMLKKMNSKLGRDKLLLWWFHIDKEYLVHVSSLVTRLPAMFNLNMIIEWSDMACASIASGNISAMKPDSWVTNNLAFVKILLNVVFLFVGHNPLTWLRAPTEAPVTPGISAPAAARTSPAATRTFHSVARTSPALARTSSATARTSSLNRLMRPCKNELQKEYCVKIKLIALV